MLVFDKAFLNGKIYTMDENQTCAEAMLVHGGKILAVGSNAKFLLTMYASRWI